MLDLINFFPEDEITAGILLDGEYERFNLNLVDWAKKNYISQWKHAAKYSLKNREVSAFIKSYENAQRHVKVIGIYTIIPEEYTIHKNDLISEDGKDFFITESFVFITENEKTFTTNKSFKKIKKTYGRTFPIFYFDKNRMDKFYLYLSDRIEGVSSWKITGKDLESILNL